jgi:ribosome-binding ATPase YchF (GTP1/OBG family)
VIFFVQVKCWQIRRQTKAPQAAGAIHTDFERGFICAEVTYAIFSLEKRRRIAFWIYIKKRETRV